MKLNDKLKENLLAQVSNIIDFFEIQIKKMKEQERIKIACILNKKEEMTRHFAKPSEYANGYRDAIKDIRDKLNLNGIYELYVDK